MKLMITPLRLAFVVGCSIIGTDSRAQFLVGPDKPYKTISAALSVMKTSDLCVISPGVYRERIDVVQSNIVLRSQGRVVISECDLVANMQPCVINGCNGLKTAVTGPVYDLFCDGRYLLPARFPDKTCAMTSNEDWLESFIDTAGNISFQEQAQRKFPELSDGYYVGLHGSARARHGKLSSWYSLTLPITNLTEHGYINVDAGKASSGFMGNFGRGKGLGYIIGAKAVLDAPGEWYSDGKELFVVPPKAGGAD